MSGTGSISAGALDDLRARTPAVDVIGRRLTLIRSGKQWVALCPFHVERTPSFYVFDDGYHCFGCGAHGDVIDFAMTSAGVGFIEAVQMLASEAGLARLGARPNVKRAAVCPPHAPRLNDTVDLARAIARETVTARGTIAETYVRSRGSELPPGDVLRFHSTCPRGADRLPAVVSIMTDAAANTFAGTHRIFLQPDGSGKIRHGSTKMMLGNSGVIRLSPDAEVTAGLGICEGIETGLSLIQRAGWRPIWAAGSAGGIAKFPVLAGVGCLTIFPDCDDSGASQRAAEVCAARWQSAGRETQIIYPPDGMDWNDAFSGVANK